MSHGLSARFGSSDGPTATFGVFLVRGYIGILGYFWASLFFWGWHSRSQACADEFTWPVCWLYLRYISLIDTYLSYECMVVFL